MGNPRSLAPTSLCAYLCSKAEGRPLVEGARESSASVSRQQGEASCNRQWAMPAAVTCAAAREARDMPPLIKEGKSDRCLQKRQSIRLPQKHSPSQHKQTTGFCDQRSFILIVLFVNTFIHRCAARLSPSLLTPSGRLLSLVPERFFRAQNDCSPCAYTFIQPRRERCS